MTASRHPDFDRSRPPTTAAPIDFSFPDFEIHSLANGLSLYVARYPRGPLVHLELVLPGGAQGDVPSRSGLACLTASSADEGTTSRTSLAIAQQVDNLGGYMSSLADWDAMAVSFGALAEHLEDGLALIADIAKSASFPATEIERLRAQQLAQIQRRQAQPSTLAADALAELLYHGEIYAQPLLGTRASVEAISRGEVLATAALHLVPAGAALVAVGDLDPPAACAAMEAVFADWEGEARPQPPQIVTARLEAVTAVIVDRPEAPQSELWLGHVGVPRNHPERPGLAVLNSLLGGKFTSRINLNLRERLGITYGASSSFSQRRGAGPFVVEASVDSSAIGKAINEVLGEMKRLQDEPVTEQELADTKSYLIGVFPYTLQRIDGLADRLGDLVVYGLPRNYFTDFFAKIETVTREEVQDLARRHLHPDRVGIAVVGPARELKPQLTPLGRLEIRPSPSS